MSAISVMIAESKPLIRKHLCELIEKQGDMFTAGVVTASEDLLDAARRLRPSILLLDLALLRRGGLCRLKTLTKDLPDSDVILMSYQGDDIYVHEAYKAGARGFQVKTAPAHELLKKIRLAAQGDRRRYCAWPRSSQRYDRRKPSGAPRRVPLQV